MAVSVYFDTSAVLRVMLEKGTTPGIEKRIARAPALITSRLSLVESARALHRIRHAERLPERQLVEVEKLDRDPLASL
jgi:predicted nucleic acid-binding protein